MWCFDDCIIVAERIKQLYGEVTKPNWVQSRCRKLFSEGKDMTELEKKLDAMIDAKVGMSKIPEPYDTRAADVYAVALDLLARIAELEKNRELIADELIRRVIIEKRKEKIQEVIGRINRTHSVKELFNLLTELAQPALRDKENDDKIPVP